MAEGNVATIIHGDNGQITGKGNTFNIQNPGGKGNTAAAIFGANGKFDPTDCEVNVGKHAAKLFSRLSSGGESTAAALIGNGKVVAKKCSLQVGDDADKQKERLAIKLEEEIKLTIPEEKMTQLVEHLDDLGVCQLSDLKDVTEDELKGLPLKGVQQKRLLKYWRKHFGPEGLSLGNE